MKLARQIERRMEEALDGLAGRIFRGGLHSSELAARLARAAELAEYQSVAGPATANHYLVLVNPNNLTGATGGLETELEAAFFEHAAERGWRLEGPAQVRIEVDQQVSTGTAQCRVSVVPGELPVWARLRRSKHGDLEIRHNRAVIGRASECDVVLDEAEVSRRHALIYRQNSDAYVLDLDSANGTTVDGRELHRTPVRLQAGSVLSLAGIELRLSYLTP
jgi:hypothetical protein